MLQQLKSSSTLLMVALIASAAVGVTMTIQPTATMAVTTSEDLCGKTISKDLVLTADVTCAGDGIKVAGDNIVINLNGFSLKGPGPDSKTTGILVDGGKNVEVKGPGMILFLGTAQNTSGTAYLFLLFEIC